MQDPQSDERAQGRESPRSLDEPSLNVLDTSALLALLFEEPGATVVADVIAAGAAMSTVNLSEAAAVLVRHQRDAESILMAVAAQVTTEPFTMEDALTAAALWVPTQAIGLSLGDRACLALAKRLRAPAVTADRGWAAVNVGVTIQLIRHVLN